MKVFAVSRVIQQLEDLAWQESLFAQVHSRQDGDEVSLILYDTSADFDFNINQVRIPTQSLPNKIR